MCFLFQPVDVFFRFQPLVFRGFFRCQTARAWPVICGAPLGLILMKKHVPPRHFAKGNALLRGAFCKRKKAILSFFNIFFYPTPSDLLGNHMNLYRYIYYIYIYYNMPRPSKSVKFQPLGLFLVVKWGTNFTPLEDSGWFGHKLSETQRRWFPSWLPHLFPFLQLSHSIHGHGYIYLHEHHNTFTKCR